MSIGKRITELRESMSLSLAGFAELAGVNEKTQLKYESNKAMPDVGYLQEMVKLGGNLDYIVTGRNKKIDEWQNRSHAALLIIGEKCYREKAINSQGLLGSDVDEIVAIFKRRGGWALLAEGLWCGAIVPSEAHEAMRQWRREQKASVQRLEVQHD